MYYQRKYDQWTPGSPVDSVKSVPVALDLDRREERAAIAGDWHQNRAWVERVIPALSRQSPGIRTILHLGDFGLSPYARGTNFLATVDYWCKTAGIHRVLVTPGNHEHWAHLDHLFAEKPDQPVWVSDHVAVLPRGFRFTLGGHTFLSFGGAASVDSQWRTTGVDWFPSEVPTDADVERAIAGGPAEIMLTHEAVNGGTAKVERSLLGPSSWPLEALYYSADSRRRVTKLWDAVSPNILLHGHMHIPDEIELADGRRVVSMGCDYQRGNIGVLDLDDLSWKWLASPETERPRRTLNPEASYLTRPDEDEIRDALRDRASLEEFRQSGETATPIEDIDWDAADDV